MNSIDRTKKVKKMKKVRATRIVLTIISTLVIVFGIWQAVSSLIDYKRTETTNDAQVEQYVAPINVKVPGYIREIRFTEHQFVHKGDTLLVIDDREYKIRLMEAQAALKDAQAGGNVIDATLNTTRSNVSVFDSSLAEVETRIDKLRRDRDRYQNLVTRDAATPVQLEQIETELAATEARLAAMKQQKRTAESSVNEVSTRRLNIEAGIMRATAAVDMASLNLSYTVITAPSDGWLGRRALEEGQLVNAGQTITYIMPDAQKWIIANYKETQVRNLHAGQEIKIKIDAYPDKEFTGQITAISGVTGSKYSLVPTDNSAGNFVKIQQRIPVRIDFTNLSEEDNRMLAAGMMAVVKANIR